MRCGRELDVGEPCEPCRTDYRIVGGIILVLAIICAVGLWSAPAHAQSACFTEVPCVDRDGVRHKSVLFPESKLERCEAYKRRAAGYDALKTSAEDAKRAALLCQGSLETSRSDLDTARAEVERLQLELASRWSWYTWASIGAAVGAGAVIFVVFLFVEE